MTTMRNYSVNSISVALGINYVTRSIDKPWFIKIKDIYSRA